MGVQGAGHVRGVVSDSAHADGERTPAEHITSHAMLGHMYSAAAMPAEYTSHSVGKSTSATITFHDATTSRPATLTVDAGATACASVKKKGYRGRVSPGVEQWPRRAFAGTVRITGGPATASLALRSEMCTASQTTGNPSTRPGMARSTSATSSPTRRLEAGVAPTENPSGLRFFFFGGGGGVSTGSAFPHAAATVIPASTCARVSTHSSSSTASLV